MSREIMDLAPPERGTRLSYGPDPLQFVEFRFPEHDVGSPLLVHIHGGFWRNRYNLDHAGHFCAAFTAAGYITANVEYRRVGDPGGGWPGTLEDVKAALHFARGHAGDRRTVVTGHSAGGHLALWLAAEEPGIDGAVALAPAACLHRACELRLGDGAAAALMGASPNEAAEAYHAACPQHRPTTARRILIHGTADEVVPLLLSREFAAERAEDPGMVKLVELQGVDHFDIIDPRSGPWRVVFESVASLIAVR